MTPPRAHPPLPDSSLGARYLAAPNFDAMLASVKKNAELWAAIHRHARVAEEYVRRLVALGGRWHLLALSEDWCGDAVNTVPVVARLVERSSNAELRVLSRDDNPDVMDTHLTNGTRSIPVIIALDEDFVERGWWGPRPTALQHWVSGQGQLLEKTARYREARIWYARDQGRTTLEEVVTMLERAAARRASARE